MKTRVYPELQWSTAPRIVLVVTFLATIALPAADHFFHIAPQVVLTENRPLVEYSPRRGERKKRHSRLTLWAELLRTFPGEFEPAFNDHFGFRSWLVFANSWLKHSVLKVSAVPLVMIGRGGWYFSDDSTDLMSDFRGKSDIPVGHLEAWRREIEEREAFCRTRGIAYLFVIGPDKQTIYPEFLPPAIAAARGKVTRLDRVLRHFKEMHSRIEPVDLRPAILKRKFAGEQLYWQTDTHWTTLGAFAAYEEILTRLHATFSDLKPEPRETFSMVSQPEGFSGDLVGMLGLSGKLRETYVDLNVKGADNSGGPVASWMNEFPWTPECRPRLYSPAHPATSHRLLMCSDSFGIAAIRLLAGHFSSSLHLQPWLLLDAKFREVLPKAIDAEQPDVFVDLIVERNLAKSPRRMFGN